MSDETKCVKCGKYNGPKDSSDWCRCPRVRDTSVSEDAVTPPTPAPRERREDGEFTALPYWEKAKRLGLPGDMVPAINAACDELFRLRVPAPSEAVAVDAAKAVAIAARLTRFARELGPEHPRYITVLNAALALEVSATHPAPARGVTVTKAVVAMADEHAHRWRDKDESYWLSRLMQEVGELASALVGDHPDPVEHELRQVASIAINWLRRRAALTPDAEGGA